MKKLIYFAFIKSLGNYLNLMSFASPKKANRMAFALFTQPREGKLRPEKMPKTLQKAAFETLDFDDQKIATYIWKGNDTVVLLVHGWESNASRWKKTLPYLQKTGSTIIAIDAPAHGLSTGNEFNVPKYAQFIDKAVQKFQPKYLIGHSIGGKACLYYQSHYENQSVEKIVTIGAPSEYQTILYGYIKLLKLNSRLVKGLETNFTRVFERPIDQFSAENFVTKLNPNIQGFVAHDVGDKVVAATEGKKIATAWDNATYLETKGLGHAMHDDDLYKKIITFLFKN